MIAVSALKTNAHTIGTEKLSCLKIFNLKFFIKRHLCKELEREMEARLVPAAVVTKHIGFGR